MSIFNVISLLGGLAFFLYGMNVMSDGLEKMSGSTLERTLRKMTSNKFKGLLLGAGITAAIQSSSAMTVMLVGFVNSGIMQLEQTVTVIMGANIGTTFTAWLTSIMGLDSDNLFVSLLKPENFSAIFALVGVMLIMLSKKTKVKDIGSILIGFAVLMFGMKLMSTSMKPLAENETFASLLTAFKNPILGVLLGTLVTGVIQSSSASVGILQALALTGNISYSIAIPIIMGQNIGTCVTSLISSIGVNKNAKRVAAVHISFNIIGTTLFLALFTVLNSFSLLPFADNPIGTVGIAICHTFFNCATTLLLLPFSKQLVKLAKVIVRGKDKHDKTDEKFIDERLLNTPSFAIAECVNRVNDMAKTAKAAIDESIRLVDNYDEKSGEKILEFEDKLDNYEDKLGSVMVELSKNDLSDADNREISKLLHSIGDFERLGDHAVNLLKTAKEIDEKGVNFSKSACYELDVLTNAINEITQITVNAFINNDADAAKQVEPLEQVIDELISTIKAHHVNRLQTGDCTIQFGFVLADLLTNYERISDHCSNIAVTLIELNHGSFDTHEYLSGVKTGKDEQFKSLYNKYYQKYAL